MANPFLVRIKRITRQPLRIGNTNITNTDDGSVVDLSGVRVSQDLYRFLGRYIVLGQAESGFAAGNYNMDPNEVTVDNAATATGVTLITAMELGKGETITGLSYLAGATALGTGTYQKAGVYTQTGADTLTLQAASTDLVATAWAANGTQAFSGGGFPYTTPKADTYYLALLVTTSAGTPPSLVGRAPFSAAIANLGIAAGTKAFAIRSGTDAALPATITVSSGLTITNKVPLIQIIG